MSIKQRELQRVWLRLRQFYSAVEYRPQNHARVDEADLMAYASRLAEMFLERRVKLFKNGRNQAVRIPREFELPGKDAIMRREGKRLIIEAKVPKSLLALLATLQPLDEEFPPITDPHPDPAER